MFKIFTPTYFENNIYDMDFKKYYEKGYRYLIFDIDNTLVEDEERENEKTIDKINEIKNMGFVCSILSNNYELRVKKFAENVGIKNWVCLAKKPKIDGYIELINRFNIDKEKTLYIGDQLFTDILGANMSKIDVILVSPLGIDKHFYIRVKRFFENVIKFIYLNRIKNADNKFK